MKHNNSTIEKHPKAFVRSGTSYGVPLPILFTQKI
nr:MAG TPA: hypothetical protein [Caudoviricetes sp.]